MANIDYKVTNNYENYRLRFINEYQQKLVKNFIKCCEWVKENAYGMTIEDIRTPHHPYHFLDVKVYDGELYMIYGSHGGGFDTRMSRFGTDVNSQGSCQTTPYRYEGVWCARTDYLEEFLQIWVSVKTQIQNIKKMRQDISSDDFIA